MTPTTGIRAGRYHVLIRRHRKNVAYEKIPLALAKDRAYIPIPMTPTPKQDPVEALRLHIAELRLIPNGRGPWGRIDALLRAIVIRILTSMADIVERGRAANLAATAPPAAPDTPPPQAGRPEHPSREAACGGGMAHGPCEQPETPEPIAEPPQANRSLPPPRRTPPAALPPQARVRRTKNKSRPAPARPRHVHDCCWPRPRGPAPLWTAEAGFLRLDSKKSVSGSWDTRAYFVTI